VFSLGPNEIKRRTSPIWASASEVSNSLGAWLPYDGRPSLLSDTETAVGASLLV